ncbi:MAG: AAA family ATPase [Chloroflexi bacterium]|nr:AAA family ATPase [Chloroflexota bacterium]
MTQAKTIGELRQSEYRVLNVKDELRKNLVGRIRSGEELFPGIVGYEETVLPQIENAILSGQDIILLGERGQAKTRIIRALVGLLDPEVPVIEGCEINDSPYVPTCSSCLARVEAEGDAAPIAWLPRERRYGEKLATPDITIADLIGEVDPIKVAEGRYLSDEFTIHYGLIPRTNRGIFCINELPDLSERIQVGMFNIMEERDVQIKGYKVQLPLDLFLIASANPEDYTNRGRIITPLKDRFGAQIRTHYPKTLEHEIEIMDAEREPIADVGVSLTMPQYMKETVAEFTNLARKSGDVNQRSGVSVRVSIGNYETISSNAVRRALRLKEKEAVPRVSDMAYFLTSTAGKVELESVEEGREPRIIEDLTKRAVLNTFNNHFSVNEFDAIIRRFDEGLSIDTGDMIPSKDLSGWLKDLPELKDAANRLGVKRSVAAQASVVEFVLDGLHLSRKINKDKHEGGYRYRG